MLIFSGFCLEQRIINEIIIVLTFLTWNWVILQDTLSSPLPILQGVPFPLINIDLAGTGNIVKFKLLVGTDDEGNVFTRVCNSIHRGEVGRDPPIGTMNRLTWLLPPPDREPPDPRPWPMERSVWKDDPPLPPCKDQARRISGSTNQEGGPLG